MLLKVLGNFIDNLMNPLGLLSRNQALWLSAVFHFSSPGADRIKIQQLHPLQHNRRTRLSGSHFLLQLRDE